MRLIRIAWFILLFVIGFFIQSFGQSQPSFLEKSQQFWKSEEFINKFMATYGVKSEVEPKINAEEKKLFNDLIPVIQQDPGMAISILQGKINTQSSAALEFTLGNLYAQTSNNSKAVNQYRAAIKKFPDFQRAHMNLGIVLIQLGQHSEARIELVRTLELGGEDGSIYGLIGYCHLIDENYLSAEAAYRKALLFSPDKTDWKLGLGQCQLQQYKYGECVTLFGELIQNNPDNKDYWLHQANAFIGLAESKKAAVNYEIVRRMGKADAVVLNQLGDIYINDGIYGAAYEAYRDAVVFSIKDKTAPPMRSVEIMISVGEYEYATALLESIREVGQGEFDEKDQLKVLQIEARLLLAKGEEVSAIAALEKIVEKNPLDGESILILADYYGRNEKIEEAELFYQRAEQIDEFEIRAKISHAQFHVQRNNFNKAVPLLKEAQSKRPRDNVQRYLDQVERLAKLKTR
jgi:Flp pilus assembly protein TadD